MTVKSEPSQADWTKVCGKDQNSGTDICYTTRDFVSDQGQPVLAVAVYEMKNAAQKQDVRVIRYLLPLGLLLQPGIRFNVDGQTADGRPLRGLLPERLLRRGRRRRCQRRRGDEEGHDPQRLGPEPDPA